MLELHHQLARRLPLEVLHHLAGRKIRGTRQKYVHMILRYMAGQYLDLVALADLDYQFSQTMTNFSVKYWFTVLCNPHKVVLDVKPTMGTRTIIFHPLSLTDISSILKVSPKGEGFKPIVRH